MAITPPNTRMNQLRSQIASGGVQPMDLGAATALSQKSQSLFAGVPTPWSQPAQSEQGASSSRDINWQAAPGDPNDSWSQAGFASNVPRSLITTESGGNWAADNGKGYHGILQFGEARYADAVKAGVVPQGMTLQQFGSNTPEGRAAQVAVSNWHFNDIDNQIARAGYDRLIGQNIGGVPITMDALRSMAHLGGFGGLSSFLRSGGSHNPADAFGTSLAAYGRTHSN